LLKQRFGKLYLAAQVLGMRNDKLSSYLWGREAMGESLLRQLEDILDIPREAFLGDGQ
jgi:hypothetical protein